MFVTYPAVFHKDGSDYWVEFPDLDGCHTYGSSLNETMVAAQEALSGYLLTLMEQEEVIAAPSELTQHKAEDGFATLVSCEINPYKDTKAVKKTLTIPAWMNERAIAKGINFSQVLQDALLVKLQA